MLDIEHAINTREFVWHFDNALPWSHLLSILNAHPVKLSCGPLKSQWLVSESVNFNVNLLISLIKREIDGESNQVALPIVMEFATSDVSRDCVESP